MKHGKQALFLKKCLRYVDAAERHKLEESISQLQRDKRCVRRALSLMFTHAALAFAGFGYCVVFLDDSHDLWGLTAHFIFRLFCVLVLVPVICVPFFLSVAYRNRRKLDQQGEECLRLITKLLETRLGKPVLDPTPKERSRNGGDPAVSSCDGEPIPSADRVDRADQTGGAVSRS
jgi:hypothetical protein